MTQGALAVPRFRGSPRAVGRAIGRAMGPRLEANIQRYLRERPPRPDAIDADRLRREALRWLDALPERFREELEGLAEGAGLARLHVAEWACIDSFLDDGCSAVLARIGGHVWIARNNDMFVPGIWGHAVVRAINGRIPTLTFGQEGDVFTATGINGEGLWLHHQALAVSDAPRPGRPRMSGWILLADMLETCATISDVEARLVRVDRDEGMLLFAVDGKTDEAALFECACSRHVRRDAGGPFAAGTNHAVALREHPSAGDSPSRLTRLEELASRLLEPGVLPRVPDDLIAILADPAVERRGARFATVYSVVACPATRATWFTFGGEPAASSGRWSPVAWPWTRRRRRVAG